MAVTKNIALNTLQGSLNYILNPEKVGNDAFVYSHNCSLTNAYQDFSRVNAERKIANPHFYSVKQRMIIQSFKPGEVTAAKAFEIAKQLAEKYLGNDYQYVLAVHEDTNHMHAHIVYNATNMNTLKSFSSKGLDFIWDLQKISDELCKENGLSVVDNKKSKGITQKEFYARKNRRSKKSKLMDIMDAQISKSSDFDDFLMKMKQYCEVSDTYPSGQKRKHLVFRIKGSDRWIRLDTLGKENLAYSKASLVYRIANHDIEDERIRKYSLYDLNEDWLQGPNKQGLQNWAKAQNVENKLRASTDLLDENGKGISINEYQKQSANLMEELRELDGKIKELDQQINDNPQLKVETKIVKLENIITARKAYSEVYPTIKELKKYRPGSREYDQFKKKHVKEFKKYDDAKYVLSRTKNDGTTVPISTKNGWYTTKDAQQEIEILNKKFSEVSLHVENMKGEREVLYTEYEMLKKRIFERSQRSNMFKNNKRASQKTSHSFDEK